MKFETQFGLDEICVYGENKSPTRSGTTDILVKVVEINISRGREIYLVEHIGTHFGVQRFPATSEQLQGDPDYDQEIGGYPEDNNHE